MTSFSPSDEQHAIISAPNGPMRISAGAGTGKTTTLAHRIAHLIDDGSDPERILGVTFTNKAAAELADRVREVLADQVDPARTVEIHTYHGFAHQILAEFGPLVGVERDTQLITPTFARQLFHDAIEGGTYRFLNITWNGILDRPARLAAALADNLAEPDQLTAMAPAEPDELWETRQEIVGIVDRYEQEKRRLGVADFGDLILRANQLVSGYPDLATRIRERYDAVFLDEYQDTNPAQRELLRTLFGGGFPITAVGDADQTIYEWRGASLANFADFGEHFPLTDGSSAPTYPLTLNRRSGQEILDLANQVRRELGEVNDPLRALEGVEPAVVAVRWEGNAVEEADFIAEQVLALHEEQGVAWKEMAVLFRKNKDIEAVRGALEDHGIPVEVANLGGLLGIPEVADVFAWLRLLDDPSDEPAFIRIAMGSRYRLGMRDLKPLSQWVRHQPELGRSMIEALDQLIPPDPDQFSETDLRVDQLDERTVDALIHLHATYRQLLEAAQGVNLIELVRRILSLTGAWPEVAAMPAAARQSARLNLYRFLDLAEEWSPLEGRPSLRAFVDYLMLMVEEQTEELDTARLSGEDAVALLTVHRSKGLEWDAVFVPALYEKNFPSSSMVSDDPYKHPYMLPYELRLDRHTLPPLTADMPEKDRKDLLRQRDLDQEWRIAYVAVTRARRWLTMTGATWHGTTEVRKTEGKPSPLFDLAANLPNVVDLGRVEDAPRPETLRRSPLAGAPDPTFPNGWDGALRSTLADPKWAESQATQIGVRATYDQAVSDFQQMLFELPDEPDAIGIVGQTSTSVTSLVTYATCPKRYYWSEVDRLPRRPSSAARRGVDVHRKIELRQRGAVPFDDVTDDLYDVPETGPSDVRGAFRVFEESRFSDHAARFIEVPFEFVHGDLRIRGRIDAVYENEPGRWEIVDFKSGRPSDNPAMIVQLQAYAVAIRQGSLGPANPVEMRATFAYLGGGALTEISENVDDDWMERARDRLTEIATGIGSAAFEPAPSEACHGCDFLRFCPEGKTYVAR
ncbi:MAG: ATP-dependent helicase [Acidimicrobiia bacterium]|nr:ATP-dependent helicase [Acidimicrobiia bacterium]MDH5420211.1 ATP-dependent helicase [Acidimicrobiia bacterium]MDH5504488.1 ATP-dependent helicase [Acidimicrobiia bacterium]